MAEMKLIQSQKAVAIRKRGAGLVDLMVAVFLLGVVGLIFGAAFPSGFSATRQAQDYKVATAIAQRKMEQLRSMNYESLQQPLLVAANVIDSESTESPYQFTSVDSVASQLTSGIGTLEITELSSDVKEICIKVRWQGPNTEAPREIELTTRFADRRPRKVN